MSAREFLQWRDRVLSAESRSETDRADWQMALIAHQVYLLPYRIFGNKGGDKILDPKDFLVKFDGGPEKKEPTPEERAAAARLKAEMTRQAFAPLIDFAKNGFPSDFRPPM